MSRFAWLLGGSLFSIAAIGFGTASAVDLLSHERSHVHVEFTQPVTELDVHNDGGSVRIEGTDAATITVDAALSEGLRSGDHSEQISGGRLELRATCPGFLSTWCGANYTVRVPRATPLVVHTSDGSITATGLTAPTVTARSNDGSVHVNFDAAPQRVDASSSDGSVTVVVPDTPDTYAVTAHTSDGSRNIDVRTDPTSDRVIQMSSHDGSVTVRYP
jgi:hypothetical protein